MARKAIVDKEIILDLLRQGETTQRIAERFNVSRQAIDLHRKDFIKQGLLPDKRAARTRKESPEPVPEKLRGKTTDLTDTDSSNETVQPELIPSMSLPEAESLDRQIDLMINAFDALKRLPELEKELQVCKQENEKARQEIERLKGREKKRLDQENRWMLIQTEDTPD